MTQNPNRINILNLWCKNHDDRKTQKTQYPAYAVKSDDGRKTNKNQYPAYAVKSDDGKKTKNQYPKPMLLKAMMAKNQTLKRVELFRVSLLER